MRRTSLSLLMLALLVGACSDDGGPRLATIDELRVVKVSGDQSSPVPDAAPAQTIYATAGASLQSSPGSSWTSEPLVARVEVVQSRGAGMSGPSGAAVPKGTLIHWELPEEAGRLRGLTTATDDTAYIVNRWAPGTRAGTYHASAHRILPDGTITDDALWELVVEPGPIWRLQLGRNHERPVPYTVEPGDTIDGRDLIIYAWDRHGNKLDRAAIDGDDGARVRWAWYDRTNGGHHAPATHEGEGWTIVVPDLSDYAIAYDGRRAPGLTIWIEGAGRNDGVTFYSP